SQEFNDNIEQVEDNYNDVDEYELQEIDNANKIQKLIFYDDFISLLYDSEIEECSKNTLASEIIEIIDSDDDINKDQHYTLLEKEK
ncbi:19162_t:CDS:2, partial [Cetraspora pellucida]